MAENNSNRLVMILAGAVVVLLIAFVAVVMLNTGAKNAPVASTTAPSATASATSNPGVGSSATEFDAATATKVPAGQDPKAYVSAYYKAIIDKKWDTAFKMQPAASQTGSVADFQSTQTMYGMKSFEVKSATVGKADATVVIEQDLGSNGTWNATWTFTKSGSDWLVKARKVGMGAAQ